MGEQQIADTMLEQLGIKVSARTVGKYWPPDVERGDGQPVGSQPWSTFVYNHSKAVVACDFVEAVTATFRTLYVFVMMEVGSRKIIHYNVTEHPTAEWTAQQFREALPGGHKYKYLIHDRDAKEMQDHERASTSVVAARRSIETRAFLEPSGALYDKLHVSHAGYAGDVSVVHKSAAVSEVVAQLAIEGDDDPE